MSGPFFLYCARVKQFRAGSAHLSAKYQPMDTYDMVPKCPKQARVTERESVEVPFIARSIFSLTTTELVIFIKR